MSISMFSSLVLGRKCTKFLENDENCNFEERLRQENPTGCHQTSADPKRIDKKHFGNNLGDVPTSTLPASLKKQFLTKFLESRNFVLFVDLAVEYRSAQVKNDPKC